MCFLSLYLSKTLCCAECYSDSFKVIQNQHYCQVTSSVEFLDGKLPLSFYDVMLMTHTNDVHNTVLEIYLFSQRLKCH